MVLVHYLPIFPLNMTVREGQEEKGMRMKPVRPLPFPSMGEKLREREKKKEKEKKMLPRLLFDPSPAAGKKESL